METVVIENHDTTDFLPEQYPNLIVCQMVCQVCFKGGADVQCECVGTAVFKYELTDGLLDHLSRVRKVKTKTVN